MATGKTIGGRKWHVIDKFVAINFGPYRMDVRARFRCGTGSDYNYIESYHLATRRGRVDCAKCRKAMGLDK